MEPPLFTWYLGTRNKEIPYDWYKENDTRCFGPGVADMKGGLFVGIFAGKALIHAGLIHNVPLTFIFNAEPGSV